MRYKDKDGRKRSGEKREGGRKNIIGGSKKI
jgi:hypothetical protein